MKKDFFYQMLEKYETSNEVEILTDTQTRSLKGGGCTCKKAGSFSCNGYSTTTKDDLKIDVPVTFG